MLDWLIPVLTVAGSILGAWIGVHGRLTRAETRIDRLEQDIGTHETGIRGTVHKSANMLIDHESRIRALEKDDE